MIENYIVVAYRYGDGDGYLVGWDNDLEKAKSLADEEWESRGCMKYSGVVFALTSSENKNEFTEVYRKGM